MNAGAKFADQDQTGTPCIGKLRVFSTGPAGESIILERGMKVPYAYPARLCETPDPRDDELDYV